MLLTELIKTGTQTVSRTYPEREAREMVFAFLEFQAGVRRHTHIIEPLYEVSDEDAASSIKAFERMSSGEPLQYVMGMADFYGRKFRVTPDVLIPRPETELLCREVVERQSHTGLSSPSILDLCTGSGCIAWTLALEIPGAEVTAVDISEGALSVASAQIFSEELIKKKAREPLFKKADVLNLSGLLSADEEYDIIVSNPPYVMNKEKGQMRSNVLDHEPHLALFVSDEDPLIFYRSIAQLSERMLKKGGYGIVEINEALGQQTADLFMAYGLGQVRIIKDLSEKDRFVSFSH